MEKYFFLFFFVCEGVLVSFCLSTLLACNCSISGFDATKAPAGSDGRGRKRQSRTVFCIGSLQLHQLKPNIKVQTHTRKRKWVTILIICLFESQLESLSIIDFLILFKHYTDVLLSEFLLLIAIQFPIWPKHCKINLFNFSLFFLFLQFLTVEIIVVCYGMYRYWIISGL